MIELIEQIRQNLRAFAYPNEASISHGIVTPILQALGWDTASPSQLVPEYTVGRRRVDFALLGAGKKPTVFVEVKAHGYVDEADRQLFEYAFHEGVPLCVLTDGADWSFYLPGAQGSYEDRRVYRLRIDERAPAESMEVLTRYLQRQRVCSGRAYEDAQQDYRTAASRREAVAVLPQAWGELLREPDSTLMSLLSVKAESLCGYAPSEEDVVRYLGELKVHRGPRAIPQLSAADVTTTNGPAASASAPYATASSASKPIITAALFGQEHRYESAAAALVGLLRLITAKDPNRIATLAAQVEGHEVNHIARSIPEIHPQRPDLVRAREFHPGWFVGLNLSNRQKMRILDAARAVYELPPEALVIDLPNA